MAPSLKRFPKRHVLPAAAITLALSAIALLASIDTEPPLRHGPRRPSGQAPVVAAVPAPAPGVPLQPSAVHGTETQTAALVIKPGTGAPSGTADQVEKEIRRSDDLLARLRVLDRALNTLDPEESVALMERLLDQTPGNAEDVKSMRIAILARLGLFPQSGRAVNRLLATTEPGVVRNERLISIETLHRQGTVPALARPFLERIAQGDHDLVVQGKARWALGLAEER